MLSFWKFITDFGDTAVTLPIAVLMAGFLLTAKHVRVAFAWCRACAGAIAALKLVLFACRHSLGISDLTSRSGHVAMSTAV
jgi:membrane-associated phospholipid phosphatase